MYRILDISSLLDAKYPLDFWKVSEIHLKQNSLIFKIPYNKVIFIVIVSKLRYTLWISQQGVLQLDDIMNYFRPVIEHYIWIWCKYFISIIFPVNMAYRGLTITLNFLIKILNSAI